MELIDDARSMVSDTASTAADFAQHSADALMKAIDTHGSSIARSVPRPVGKKKTAILPLSAVVIALLVLFVGWRIRRASADDHAKQI